MRSQRKVAEGIGWY